MQNLRDNLRYWLGLKLFDIARPNAITSKNYKKFVFLRWDAKWGDAIVSSFVFDEIRKKYPTATITVVATNQMSPLFSDYYQVDEVIEVKKRQNYKELKQLAEKLGDVDVLVHMNSNLKMKDLYFLNKVRTEIIAGLDDRVNLINLKLGEKTQNMHFAEKFAELMHTLAIDIDQIHYKVPINKKAQTRVAQLLNAKSNEALIVINPYGSGNARKLTPEIVKQIIEFIQAKNAKANIAILHSPDTRQEVADLCEDYKQDNIFYDEQSRSIFDAIALIEKSALVISVDTAIVHIASGLNKPLLAIYNPDDQNYNAWHPRSEKAIVIFSEKKLPYDVSNIDRPRLATEIEKIMDNLILT